MFSKLETNIDDPAQRLMAIADVEFGCQATQFRRSVRRCCRTGRSSPRPRCSASRCGCTRRSRLCGAQPVHNLVISNVPGPQVPLYLLGC